MSSAQSTHPFTCNSCQVAFKSSELQRTHMQTDWHRYNLKRRVASLPPLSSEIFNEKVLATKAADAATVAKASFQRNCDACRKQFFSQNAYTNHLASSKHKNNVSKSPQSLRQNNAEVGSVISSTFSLGGKAGGDEDSADEDIDDAAEAEFSKVVRGIKDTRLEDIGDENDPISRRPSRPHASRAGEVEIEHPLSPETARPGDGELSKDWAMKRCLFCNRHGADVKSNIQHMQKDHGLFIPEKKYLVDPAGLLYYLSRKVHDDYQCLFCGRHKWSEEGIKTHMRDSSHCKIAYETEDQQLELGEFYDFRSTYSDDEEEDVDMDENEENSASPEDDGWETSSDVSSVPTEELGKMYYDEHDERRAERLKSHRHHSHASGSKHRAADGYHSHAHYAPLAVYHDDVELHLPSGRVAGHRSQNKYWRQNLHSYPSHEERIQRLLEGNHASDEMDLDGEQRERGRTRDNIAVSRRDGGLGMLAVSDAKKREVAVAEKRERRKADRFQAKKQWKTDRMGNHQKHYRDPLLQ